MDVGSTKTGFYSIMPDNNKNSWRENGMANTDVAQAAIDGAKVVSVWTAVGITSWGDAASAMAFLYTALLALEWIWKKLARPFAEKRGWLTRKARRRDDN